MLNEQSDDESCFVYRGTRYSSRPAASRGIELVRVVVGVPLLVLLPHGQELDALGIVRDNLTAVQAALADSTCPLSDWESLLDCLLRDIGELVLRGIGKNAPVRPLAIVSYSTARATLESIERWLADLPVREQQERPRRSRKANTREADLRFLADWERARSAGVEFKGFCRDHGLTLKQGHQVRNRASKARARAGK